MKQKLLSMLALTLCLTTLCGCSGISMEKIGSFLSGEEHVEEPPAQQETPETPKEDQTMASEAVMEQAAAPDVLRLAYQEEYGLNPFTTYSLNNRTILSLLYEPLFVITEDFEPEYVLASDLQVSNDGLTTTITLRPGVKFHNGDALTADDVLYSYALASDSDYYGNRFIHITSVTATNARTVVFTTRTSYENLALLLDFPIVREGTGGLTAAEMKALKDAQKQAQEAGEPLPEMEEPADPVTLVPEGTGPFVYSSSYELKRFDQWWQKESPMGYQAAALTPCTTAADIRDHFEYGKVNLVCTDPSSAAYATYHNDFERWGSPTTVMQYIGFNHNDKVFGVDAVRACVTYVLNRDLIVAEDLGGFGLPASLPASPLSPYYDAGLAADYGYNMNAFNELLASAEIKDYTEDGVLDVYVKDFSRPLAGKMIVNASSNQRVKTANRIAEALNNMGFSITVEPLEEKDYQNALKYQNFQLYYGEIRMSPNFDLGSFFRELGSANYGGMVSGTGVTLCGAMLENSGNAYDLHKWVMDKGYLCPVLFKSYAVYTTRGAASDLSPAVDWVVHY